MRTSNEDGTTCLAWSSPDSAIQRMVRSINHGRPEVQSILVQMEWTITQSDGWTHQLAGTWVVEYPAPTDDSRDEDEHASEDGDADNDTLLPFDNEFIKLTVLDSDFHGACSDYLRAQQAVNMRGRGRRAVRGGQRARRTAVPRS
jgi:hypothetical protein